MSDSNRTRIGWVKEATAGTTPSNPAWNNLRVKGMGLGFNPKYKESAELRSDRMVADMIRVAMEAGGTIPVEMSWRSIDGLAEFQFQSNWQRMPARDNNGTAASVITSVAGSGVYNFSAAASPTTDYSSGSFVVGQLVRATGFGVAANNGLMRVTTGGSTSFTASGQATSVEASPAAAARLKVIGFRGVASDITATATGLASTALDFTTLGLIQGQWVKVGGSTVGEQFATAANNGWARINGTITATALPLDNLPSGWGVDAGTGKTITVQLGDVLKNGTVEQTMSIEVQYQDLTAPEYDVYPLCALDKTTLDFKSNDIVNAMVEVIAGTPSNGTTRTAGSTDIAAPTNDVLSTGANIGVIAENGVALSGVTAVTAATVEFSNSLRRRPALGALGTVDIASGTARCKVKLEMYYASNTIRTKILNGTSSSFSMRTVDATAPNGSRAYVIDIPKLKYEAGNVKVPGIDTDRTLDPSFDALAHPTLGYAFSLQRIEEYF